MLYLGSDHAGFELKENIKRFLEEQKIKYEDMGTNSIEPVDYPQFANLVAEKVAGNPDNKGILFCRSGQGMAIAANRHQGIRAALAWSPEVAAESRKDNDSNILSLPAGYISADDAANIVQAWLDTPFSSKARHSRRIAEIDKKVI